MPIKNASTIATAKGVPAQAAEIESNVSIEELRRQVNASLKGAGLEHDEALPDPTPIAALQLTADTTKARYRLVHNYMPINRYMRDAAFVPGDIAVKASKLSNNKYLFKGDGCAGFFIVANSQLATLLSVTYIEDLGFFGYTVMPFGFKLPAADARWREQLLAHNIIGHQLAHGLSHRPSASTLEEAGEAFLGAIIEEPENVQATALPRAGHVGWSATQAIPRGRVGAAVALPFSSSSNQSRRLHAMQMRKFSSYNSALSHPYSEVAIIASPLLRLVITPTRQLQTIMPPFLNFPGSRPRARICAATCAQVNKPIAQRDGVCLS
ncbi:related to RRP14-protein involved in Ribosomal RNA Processing [Sporisorium scitamineum]|uniref:Related to RRP14-protein involved in Ribosomal RNA Processing n=1 Tax=Sporisorium scitamineum TaxID=49012 RepID=A0A127Z2V9_9BASI|nr:related to RRP14-protein involved in Ribosomal RNA Processing [Sporisorium scitamineum]